MKVTLSAEVELSVKIRYPDNLKTDEEKEAFAKKLIQTNRKELSWNKARVTGPVYFQAEIDDLVTKKVHAY